MPKILLVEDDTLGRETTFDFLEMLGFEVIWADNGEVGLALARATLPDLIISDIVLPGLDGYQLLAALREHPLTAPIPLIILSGLATQMDQLTGLAAGAASYVVKPFRLSELLEAIETCLAKPKATTPPIKS